MATAGGARLTREEMKQQKAVEEARKAGTLPPEVDDDGNMINPHIPKFMADAPWYVNQQKGLAHQKSNLKPQANTSLDYFTQRGKKRGPAAKTFRKGACKNCGAMTHKEKDCVERPRAVGAWKTGKNIQADEVLPEKKELSFDAVRDRWSGYNPSEYMKQVDLYNKAKDLRAKKRAEEKTNRYLEKEKRKEEKRKRKGAAAGNDDGDDDDEDSDSDSDSDDGSDDEHDDVKQGEDSALTSQKVFRVGTAVKSTVRNLRIREDTAKYLRNLNTNSAYYDPKSRSMRDNPTPHLNPNDLTFAGDNYVRISGDAVDMAKAQLFAWDANNRGNEDVHLQANPTQVMLAQKEFKEKKEKLKSMKRTSITEKYGGTEHFKKPEETLLYGDSETYVEYGRDGRLIKGEEEVAAVSKYEENVLNNNHTAVWGSFFDKTSMLWGYGCCWQTTRNCYCTGEEGKQAIIASREFNFARAKVPEKLVPGMDVEESQGASTSKDMNPFDRSKLYGEADMDAELDQDKLKAAIKKQKKKMKEDAEAEGGSGRPSSSSKKRRKYNSSNADDEVTAEDMEAYRLTKTRGDDPMQQFQGKGGDYLLPK